VLVARYGEAAGRLEVGGRSGSFWWREIAKIRDGDVGEEGGWFGARVSKVIGRAVKTGRAVRAGPFSPINYRACALNIEPEFE